MANEHKEYTFHRRTITMSKNLVAGALAAFLTAPAILAQEPDLRPLLEIT
jgi:hypothetical protein